MKKDPKDKKLPEDQLENVQGGFGSPVPSIPGDTFLTGRWGWN